MATKTKDNRDKVFKAVRAALKQELLIGIPAENAARAPEPGEKGPPINNAVLGYILETGDPAMNLPERPFLVPGVQAIKGKAAGVLVKGITGAFHAKPGAYKAALDEVGAMGVAAVQAKMIAGPFAPLAQSTIEARARRRYEDTGKLHGTAVSRNARKFLELQKQGTPDWALNDAGLATPLLDTRSLFRSITYVIRQKGS